MADLAPLDPASQPTYEALDLRPLSFREFQALTAGPSWVVFIAWLLGRARLHRPALPEVVMPRDLARAEIDEAQIPDDARRALADHRADLERCGFRLALLAEDVGTLSPWARENLSLYFVRGDAVALLNTFTGRGGRTVRRALMGLTEGGEIVCARDFTILDVALDGQLTVPPTMPTADVVSAFGRATGARRLQDLSDIRAFVAVLDQRGHLYRELLRQRGVLRPAPAALVARCRADDR